MPRDIWESVPALYPTRSDTHPQSEATGYGGGGYDEVWEGMRENTGTGPNFFRTRASSWSCFFCRVMELVQLFCSLVSSSSFRRYSRWVS